MAREKLEKYEAFVDQRLKPDLVHMMAERDKVFEQQKVFSDLAKSVQVLKGNGSNKLRTLVNLGSEVYAQAEVPDTQYIFVDVGLGFHVQFAFDEALQFIGHKQKLLAKESEEKTSQISSIKAQIKLVLEGIRELSNIPDWEPSR